MDSKIISAIEAIVGKENVKTSEEERRCYSYDARTGGAIPDLVVFPSSAQDVSAILKLANLHHFPVIPRGQGSGLTGGSVPVNGGVVLSFTRMNRILDIDAENLIAIVEPGVINFLLQQEVAKKGLFYPPDPASYKYSSIGGNVAECAGGPNSLKYGVTRDYVLGMEVVLPTGEILDLGVKTMKGVVGYDLTRIFVGSEGTLGVITKIILKLIPLPETKATILALFGRRGGGGKDRLGNYCGAHCAIHDRVHGQILHHVQRAGIPHGTTAGRRRPSSHRDRREQGIGPLPGRKGTGDRQKPPRHPVRPHPGPGRV